MGYGPLAHFKGPSSFWARMNPDSAMLSTFIKLPFVIKIFVSSFFEMSLKTGFTVLTTYMYFLLCGARSLAVR